MIKPKGTLIAIGGNEKKNFKLILGKELFFTTSKSLPEVRKAV